MCGRMVASSPSAIVADLFSCHRVGVEVDGPRFNVAPTDGVATVVEREGERSLETRRWGLVPSWADSSADAAKRINARAETVHELPAFRGAFARRRCIVPADGFYEWRGGQAYFVRARDSVPLALAGLRAAWESRDRAVLRTCAVVTTAANTTLSRLHDRMPVILPPGAWDAWLDGEERDVGFLRSLLVPAPAALLEIVPVSSAVNNVRNDGPHLVERVPELVQDVLPF